MSELTLAAAQTIITAGLAEARAKKMKPLGIAVLDARGALKAAQWIVGKRGFHEFNEILFTADF